MRVEIEGSCDEIMQLLSLSRVEVLEDIGQKVRVIETDPTQIEPDPEPPTYTEVEKKVKRTMKRKKPSGGRNRVIDVFVGEEGRGFQLDGSFESVYLAAKHVGATSAANIYHCIDKDVIYKRKYKFVTRLDRGVTEEQKEEEDDF